MLGKEVCDLTEGAVTPYELWSVYPSGNEIFSFFEIVALC